VDTVRYRTRSSVMAFGALIALAGIAGGYFFPGVMKPVETVMGTILTAHFSPAVGKYSLSRHSVGVLTVLYVVDGKPRKVAGSTSAPADAPANFMVLANTSRFTSARANTTPTRRWRSKHDRRS
jgi:hypothetical protein